jgi:hypothetical protein
MGPNKPPARKIPIPEEPPGEGPILNDSIGDLARSQADLALKEVKEKVGVKVAPAVASFVAFFLPGSSVPFDKLIFFLALIMVIAAYPLAMKGPAFVPYLFYGLPPIAIFGWLWRSRVLAILAIVLSLGSIGEGYGLIAHWKTQEAEQKQRAIAAAAEEKRLKAEQEEAARKAEQEKIEREAKEAIAKAEAEKRAKEIEARQKDENFDRTMAEKEKARQAAEKKRQEELALAKKKQEEEEAKKRAAEDAERAKKAALDKRDQLREAAKADYSQKSLALDEATTALRAIELKIKAEKNYLDEQQVLLDRENSPKPPSDAELEKARTRQKESKVELAKLQEKYTGIKAAYDTAVKEKKAAETTLDELLK